MTRWNLAWLISVPLVVVLGLTLSLAAPDRGVDKDYEMVRTIVNVLAEIDQNFVRKLDDKDRQQLVEDMINGGLRRLDPYSEYLNADDLKHFETTYDGKFGGIGVIMGPDPRTGLLTVVSPIPGTPAFEAGLQAGDIILKIDDKSAENIKMSEATKLIMGEPGTKVTLTVLHEAAEKSETVTIERAKIEVDSVSGWKRQEANPKLWEYFPAPGIGYIHVTGFNERTAGEIRSAIEQMQKVGLKSLIIDLRGNPGGLLTSAIEIADMFLTEGRIVSTRDRNNEGRIWTAKESGTLLTPTKDHPLVVLIDRDSASASEIVSAALQDNNRAVIIGERSYGKGSVQKILPLSKDPPTALKLTTEKYWRPSGKNIHRDPRSKDSDEWGVSPNEGFDIRWTDEERIAFLRYQRTRDMVRGKNNNGQPPKPKEKDGKEEKPFVDRQMQKALDYLKGL